MLKRLIAVALLAAAFLMPAHWAITTASKSGAVAAPRGCLPGLLKKRLNQIRKKFGKITVISTHRPGARIAGSGRPSYHATCRAVDFKPPRGKYRQVANWLKKNHRGGVGTYSCRMSHIHIDNGPRVRFHKCVR